MRRVFVLISSIALLSCDSDRVYEENKEFPKRYWALQDTAAFSFDVTATATYNLHCNVRNTLDYPFARIFVRYSLSDSTGKVLASDMVSTYLFDLKTGEPYGNSSLGDIYDHRILLKSNQALRPGRYDVKLQQLMRADTLKGVLAAGVRVERVKN